MGMFDFGPTQRSAGIQQAFDQLGQQLNFGAQQVNLKDPASLRAKAQEEMDRNNPAEAQKYNQMADALEQKQQEGREDNISRSYHQVKGTPQEEQFRQAMKEAGQGDIIRGLDNEDRADKLADIQYDNAKDTFESKGFLKRYQAADTPELKRQIMEEAKERGLTQHIEEYERKETEFKWKQADEQWTVSRRKVQEAQDKVDKMQVPPPGPAREAFFKFAEQGGQGDYARQRAKAYDEYLETRRTADSLELRRKARLDKDTIADAGMTEEQYQNGINAQGAITWNDEVLRRAAANSAKRIKTYKPATSDDVADAKAMLEGVIEVEGWIDYSWFDFDIGKKHEFEGLGDINMDVMAADLAQKIKNSDEPPSLVIQQMINDLMKGEDNPDVNTNKIPQLTEESAMTAVQLHGIDNPKVLERIEKARSLKTPVPWVEIYRGLKLGEKSE